MENTNKTIKSNFFSIQFEEDGSYHLVGAEKLDQKAVFNALLDLSVKQLSKWLGYDEDTARAEIAQVMLITKAIKEVNDELHD